MSTSETKKKITLKSSDGEELEVDVDVALQSQTLKHIIDDDCADAAIPIPNVDSKTLTKVIEYCNFHVASDKDNADEVKAFDVEFVRCDEINHLFDIVLAANYLDIKSLLSLTCHAIADNIKDKTPEEVRTIFNIENDFTPEEEEALRKENEWAFDSYDE